MSKAGLNLRRFRVTTAIAGRREEYDYLYALNLEGAMREALRWQHITEVRLVQ